MEDKSSSPCKLRGKNSEGSSRFIFHFSFSVCHLSSRQEAQNAARLAMTRKNGNWKMANESASKLFPIHLSTGPDYLRAHTWLIRGIRASTVSSSTNRRMSANV